MIRSKCFSTLALAMAFVLLGTGDRATGATWILATGKANGDLSAYELDGTGRTWDQARINAMSQTFNFGGNIINGHLATIGNNEENARLHYSVGSGDRWIGYTDSTATSTIDNTDLSLLGTFEAGNTSGSPLPVGTAPVAGQRGAGYRWVTGEPVTYQAWGESEPNDSGGEDAAHMRGDGAWNDHNAGTSLGESDQLFNSIIEYDLGVNTHGALTTDGFLVKVVKAGDGGMAGLRTVDSMIATIGTPGTVVGGPTAIAFADFDQNTGGNFGVNNPFPGLPQGGDFTNDAAVLVEGTISVGAAGNYVFRMRGDDGGRLRIDGIDVMVDDNFHGFDGDDANIFLTAGVHTIEWVNFEGGGGWGAELQYSNNGGGSFVLVGDGSHGITANMSARTLKVINDDMNGGIAKAIALLNGQIQAEDGTPVVGLANVINMLDSGGDGHFGNNDTFLGIGGDDFALEATGFVEILQAGTYTFGTNADDGVRLTVAGNMIINDDPGLHGPEDRFGQIFLAAGFHPIQLIYYEAGGGSEVELFAAQGSFTSFDGNGFQLIGDTANDGLRVVAAQAPVVPEPATALLGLLALGGLARRRRHVA